MNVRDATAARTLSCPPVPAHLPLILSGGLDLVEVGMAASLCSIPIFLQEVLSDASHEERRAPPSDFSPLRSFRGMALIFAVSSAFLFPTIPSAFVEKHYPRAIPWIF